MIGKLEVIQMDKKEFSELFGTLQNDVPTRKRKDSMTVELPPKEVLTQLQSEYVGKVVPIETLKKLFGVKNAEGKSENSLINNVCYQINNEVEKKHGMTRFMKQRNIGTKDNKKLVAYIGKV